MLPSCDIINPAEQIPAYLQIDTITFTALPGQGSSSQKITDVWIDANNAAQGVYEIPATFPVLDSGQTSLVISAGILDNGISATHAIYPFYYPDTLTINLEEKKIYPLTPHFTYRSVTKFSFIEDFEAGNILSQISGDSNLIRTNETNNVFEGNYSGYIFLDSAHNVYEGRTSNGYVIPKGSPVYLELNYKCDQAFEVGLYGTATSVGNLSEYKWIINPKENWNKIYLDMTKDVNDLNADLIQVQFRAVFDGANPSSHIYLDNIKLVNY